MHYREMFNTKGPVDRVHDTLGGKGESYSPSYS